VKTYEVTSDKVDGYKVGDIVSEIELPGVNFDALKESGHVKETNPNPNPKKD